MSVEGSNWAKIRELLDKHEDDRDKAQAGNKSAGTRARIALMEIKKLAHEERAVLNDLKKAK